MSRGTRLAARCSAMASGITHVEGLLEDDGDLLLRHLDLGATGRDQAGDCAL
jgi:hypothetical protein